MGENKEKEASLDLTSTFYSSPSGIMEGLWRPEAFPAAALELGDVAVSLTHASEGSVQGAGLIVRLSSCLPPAPSEARPQGAAGPLGTLPLPRPPWLQERQRMSDRLEDTSLRLKDEMDLYKRMMDKLRHNRLEFQKEREATQEVGRQAPGRPPPHVHAPANRPLSPAAHRGLAEGAGAPADVQAGLRAAGQGPQLVLQPRRVQRQGPRGRVGARGQAAQAGSSREPASQGTRCPGPLGVRLLCRPERWSASFPREAACFSRHLDHQEPISEGSWTLL